ncbi:uncharacterized protein LOC118778917 [Megalops cyprinoides]|uniref:uncharacterized protein LOC118778917 n=1 Tax=Megalops cyprinoides TaxID=118141 RepID=UPI001865159E|nr:uncharacterized protein LOC118778917 [Megalops cyprinoides]
MLHYCLVHTAYHLSRRLPKHRRLKLPRSSRYCQQPLLNNLACFIMLSLVATGFAVVVTLLDPVPQSFKAAFHVFGVVSFTEGLCTTALTATAANCLAAAPACGTSDHIGSHSRINNASRIHGNA